MTNKISHVLFVMDKENRQNFTQTECYELSKGIINQTGLVLYQMIVKDESQSKFAFLKAGP